MRNAPGATVWSAVFLLTSALLCTPLRAAELQSEPTIPLNLFQKVARADLVVDVTIRDGALRFAVVDVRRALKGRPPADRLRVAFRDYNFDRPPGVDPIVFPNGQEEILFLVPNTQVRRKDKNKDIFELYLGQEGRITVPREGAGMLFEALGRLVELASKDPASQIEALGEQLGGDNLYLLLAGLDEIERLRAGTPALFSRLISLLQHPAPAVRSKSLRVLGEVFSGWASASGADGPPDQGESALAAVLERARNDSQEEVRVRAVAALASWPVRARVEGDLKAIAGQDPAQAVRYEAQKALLNATGR